jgi:hypothetical protein
MPGRKRSSENGCFFPLRRLFESFMDEIVSIEKNLCGADTIAAFSILP